MERPLFNAHPEGAMHRLTRVLPYECGVDIDGFSMVFSNSGVMVSDGFDLEKT